ncbi:protoporphyrinogen oxidase [Cytobacillus firmus]|uniref:Coproporphyrinogen III oxidase n=1 Tax=Cytobacillus firmus TaxID=1399 RepID=A0A800N902_CYTFI|nr:protoporphyrinogen oxidase [Cytobacillus firmus]KAF0822069.1 Protoporphyrinogen IX oxidase HemY [Cytobacillus firmus]MBG9547909.1 protoporphyrinogen oxidase [Cytobacillus firmus]MBG9601216.1 protoporphyrinogen oxidase [Cytobacillus firmus]MED1939148.1 protoporphyrinogen oxidase [Cytobacillus firmus]
MQGERQKVIVAGGGITGLAAAYYLQKEAKEKGLALDVKLIEASHRLGGKIQTIIRDGFVIERGPDSFLARKQSAARLAREAGLEKELVRNTSGKSYVLVRQRLYPMPGGSIMGIPTQIAPFITTGLFSPAGKARAAADFVLPRSNPSTDQSLGAFFRRRLGDEVVDNLIEPLLSGIYAGDIDQLSLMATFPQFYQVEQKYRSLIMGMKKAAGSQPKQAGNSKSKEGMFLTFKSGLQSLVDALESKLEPGTVLKGHRIESVIKNGKSYTVEINGGESLNADCIVMAVPHHALCSIFSGWGLFEQFKEMPSASVATVALAFPEDAIERDIDGTGFVVSRNSDYTITACTWTHKKWPHSTPKGKVLLRCYVGKAGDEAVVDLSDDQIIKVVLDDLNKTMNINMNPEFCYVTRWKDSMPQYTVGHKERVGLAKKQAQDELPGIFLAGSSYEGLGVPDCIDQAEEAVRNTLEYLQIIKPKAVRV